MSEFKKIILATVVTVALSMITAGLMVWKSAVSRDDVESMIESSHVPITQTTDSLQKELDSDSESIDSLVDDVHEIKIQQVQIATELKSKLELIDMKLQLMSARQPQPPGP